MGKAPSYSQPEKFKNYSLPTSKPFKSHAFYQEKVWTLQEQAHKKLKKIGELVESLYPKLTDNFSGLITGAIEKNLGIIAKNLSLIQSCLHENPDAFNTDKLKSNIHSIAEMKKACDTLQTVRSYEHEFKRLSKIKHVLHELDHLIQPTSTVQPTTAEKSLEKTPVKSKSKAVALKKEKSLDVSKKAVSKKAKPTTKLPKQKKVEGKLQAVKAPTRKLKEPETKLSTPSKQPVKPKKVLATKSKPIIKSSREPKTTLPSKPKKVLATKSKPIIKSSVEPKTALPVKHKRTLTAKSKKLH